MHIQDKNYFLTFPFFATVTMVHGLLKAFVSFVFHVKQHWASLR